MQLCMEKNTHNSAMRGTPRTRAAVLKSNIKGFSVFSFQRSVTMIDSSLQDDVDTVRCLNDASVWLLLRRQTTKSVGT